MTEKIATPKTTVPAKPKTSTIARKPSVAKAPVVKAIAPKAPKTASAVETKIKKVKGTSGKVKVVRDSFTMPKSDYAKIGELKQLCLKDGIQVKKSELLRAGLHAISKLSAAQLKAALSSLEKIETGRPKKN
jgi:hypothetical protein